MSFSRPTSTRKAPSAAFDAAVVAEAVNSAAETAKVERLALADDSLAPLDERQQQFECPRAGLGRFAIEQQLALGAPNLDTTKAVTVAHRGTPPTHNLTRAEFCCRSAQSQSWLRSVASGRPVIGKPSCSCGMSAVGRSVPVANAGNTTPKIVRRLLAFENHGPIDKTRPGPVVASAAKQPVTPTFQVPLIGNRPLE